MTATPDWRSAAMAKNRTGNSLERRFRMILVRNRIRHQVQPRAPMSPDFHLPDLNLDVFVDGCFWHYCPLHHRQPKTNTAHWNRKRARNAFHEHIRTRLKRPWIRVWEHDIDDPGLLDALLRRDSALLAWPLSQ